MVSDASTGKEIEAAVFRLKRGYRLFVSLSVYLQVLATLETVFQVHDWLLQAVGMKCSPLCDPPQLCEHARFLQVLQ